MAKAKAKSKPCAKAKCKGKGKGKGKGRGKGKGFGRGTALALQGLARRQAASRKRKEQVLEQMPGPAVEEDPEIAELQEELASQLLDTNVDDGANPDSLALPAEPCVHAPSPREPAPSLEPCADPPSPHTGEGEPRPPAEEPCVDASRPHSVLGGAGVAHEETTVQAQPPNGTLPDPISGPRDSGMAQASSSSGSAPAQVLDDAAHRGQASQRAQREHGPHLNNTPDFLSELDPPEDFRLRLSFNDHRFKAEIMTKQYVSSEGKKSCSKSFANDRSEWKQALAQVHRWAWTEWEKAKPERQLPPHCQPGTIPEAVLERLAPIIDAMSPPTKYAK